jgi:hypothetical protein
MFPARRELNLLFNIDGCKSSTGNVRKFYLFCPVEAEIEPTGGFTRQNKHNLSQRDLTSKGRNTILTKYCTSSRDVTS